MPLLKNYQQDLDTMISEANKNASTVGLFYLCNPNNPTGMVISAADVKKVVEGIPKTMPILIDEAYHHFVDDPAYGTSIPYVIEGRPVVIARTFSKIAALAAMRVGYAISTPEIIKQLRVYASNSVNVLAKHGAVASLKDTAGQAEVKAKIIGLRNKTTRELEAHGYPVIPSQTNFFMVSLGTARCSRPSKRSAEGHPRRPAVPADAEPPARLGRPARRDGQVHQDLQGDLPEEVGRLDDGARLTPESNRRQGRVGHQAGPFVCTVRSRRRST